MSALPILLTKIDFFFMNSRLPKTTILDFQFINYLLNILNTLIQVNISFSVKSQIQVLRLLIFVLLMHEGASNQPTYATDINTIKEIKGDGKNQP